MVEPTTQEVKVLRVPSSVKNLVEALIFAAKDPLSIKQVKAIYEQENTVGETRTIEADEVREIILELNEEFQKADKPYRIVDIAGGYQFATLSQYAEWLGKLYKEQARRKLSQSSIETLAIIAYKQPVSRPDIEAIRGVNCDYVLATLLEKDMVTIVGRAPTAGRPLLYGTTKEFLKHFGLNEITDLPRPREIEEILGESQFETERRMLEAQAQALENKEEEDFKSRLPHIPKRKPQLADEVKILPKKKLMELKTHSTDDVPPKGMPGNQDGETTTVGPQLLLPADTNQSKQEETGPLGKEISPTEQHPNSEKDAEVSGEKDGSEFEMPRKVEFYEEADQNKIWDSDRSGNEPPSDTQIQPIRQDENAGLNETTRESGREEFTTSQDLVPPGSSALQQQTQMKPSLVTQPEPKSVWHAWKEKIQTFIRKLFG